MSDTPNPVARLGTFNSTDGQVHNAQGVSNVGTLGRWYSVQPQLPEHFAASFVDELG
jgi:hypothetical protein